MQLDLLKALQDRNVPVVSTLLVNHSFLRELEERGSRRTPIFIIADTFEDEDTTYIFKQLLSIDFHFLRKDVNQRTVFFPLARRGMAKSFKLLIQKYNEQWSDIDSFGQTPLFTAARYNQLQIFRVVPLSQILLNKADEIAGQTVLFHAVVCKHYDLTLFLLKHGANPSIIDNCGNTVLDYTSLSKNQDIQFKNAINRFKGRAQIQKDKEKPNEGRQLQAPPNKEINPQTQAYKIKILSEQKTEILSNPGIDKLFAKYKQIDPKAQAFFQRPESATYSDRKRWRVIACQILKRCMKRRYGKWFEHSFSSTHQLLVKELQVKKEIRMVGLLQVEEKLQHSVYLTPTEFMTELTEVWKRCEKMNPKDSGIVLFAGKLKNEFYKQCNKVDFFDRFCVGAQ